MSDGSSCIVPSIALQPAASALLGDIGSLLQGHCCPPSLAPGSQGWALGHGWNFTLARCYKWLGKSWIDTVKSENGAMYHVMGEEHV